MANPQNTSSPRTTESTTTTTTTRTTEPSPLGRVLPHDDDAERAVLGSMILQKEVIADVITVLRDAGAAAFDNPRHQHLYEVLVHFYTQNLPIDGVPLRDELTRRGLWEQLGGYEFLAGLVNAVPSALRARNYADIVRDKHLLRQLIGATHTVMEAAYDGQLSAQDTLDLAEKKIFEVTERRVSGEATPLAVLVQEAFHTIEKRGDDILTGEPTGFTVLNEYTSGLQRSELAIVAGRPSMGKTAFGLNIAEHMAIVEHRPVLFFSLEMSRQQVAQRVLCSRARVDSHRIRRGRVSDAELEQLKHTADQLSSAPLLVDDTGDLTILELRARARMAHRRHGIRAIFVDYLQLMHLPKSESRQQEVASISRGLKALAKDLEVPVVAMAQLNRKPEDTGRRGNRPRMSDLRESGAIEQDADVIMLLHREAYYRSGPADTDPEQVGNEAAPGGDENVAELIIAKQRNGPVGTIKLHWNSRYTRFDDHDPRGMDPDYAPPYEDPTPF
ncbi:MAG: replicative DNA helicase [Phycisphaerae bacterium]|jgi:replicative DNA helicase